MRRMSDQPVATSPRGGFRAFVCWIVIVVSIGYVAGRVYWRQVAGRAPTAEQLGQNSYLDLELSARVLVGQKQLAVDLEQPATAAQDAFPALEGKARTPGERVRVA